jgi:hypothetical protein
LTCTSWNCSRHEKGSFVLLLFRLEFFVDDGVSLSFILNILISCIDSTLSSLFPTCLIVHIVSHQTSLIKIKEFIFIFLVDNNQNGGEVFASISVCEELFTNFILIDNGLKISVGIEGTFFLCKTC